MANLGVTFMKNLLLLSIFIINLLADDYEQAVDFYNKQNYKSAAKLFENLCNRDKDMRGCFYLGLFYEDGKVFQKDYKKAVELHNLACNYGNMGSCGHLGYLYENGFGINRSIRYAETLYINSCTNGYVWACYKLGEFYMKSSIEKNGNDANYAKSAVYSKIACENGLEEGCVNLAILHKDGKGVKKDVKFAFDTFLRNCNEIKLAGCGYLGYMYENGEGVEKSAQKAQHFYQMLCDKKDKKSCCSLALLLKKTGDKTGAIANFNRACELDYDLACFELANLYENSVEKEERKLAKEIYEKSCSLKNAQACMKLGILYTQGKTIAQDYKKAVEFFNNACEFGLADGCVKLADIYEKGFIVKQNLLKTKEFHEKACELGEKSSCLKFEEMNSIKF